MILTWCIETCIARRACNDVCLQASQLQGILMAGVETYLADRHVADVLTDFPDAHLPLTEVRSAAQPVVSIPFHVC